ncbi:MAG: hypothetical protein ACYCSQ_00320 [bacterium]
MCFDKQKIKEVMESYAVCISENDIGDTRIKLHNELCHSPHA